MSQLRRQHVQTRQPIDLTALVDVALTLVVFLLLGSRAAEQQGVPVAVPGAETGVAVVSDAPVRIVISPSGELGIDQQSLGVADLSAVVNKGQAVVLLADAECRHGRIVEVLDALRSAEVGAVYYATQPPDAVLDF